MIKDTHRAEKPCVGFRVCKKDPDAETRSRSFHFASSVDDSWNEKTAGIFALRPTGLKYVDIKTLDPPSQFFEH